MSHSTNKLADYDQAIGIFNQISQDYPSTPQAVLAWGQKANCFLQRGLFTQQYDEAIKAFQHLIADSNAHVTARSQAKVGLGIVLEKQADQPGTADKSDGL